MPINDPTNVQFYTGYNTFKNYESVTNTLTIPASSFAAPETKLYTMTLELGSDLASTIITHNFSLSPTKYYVGSFIQVNFIPTSSFSTQVRCSISGTTLTVNCYIINQAGPGNSADMTLTTTATRFITPFG